MLNLIQHLTKSITCETLKRVQGDRLGLFTRSSKLKLDFMVIGLCWVIGIWLLVIIWNL